MAVHTKGYGLLFLCATSRKSCKLTHDFTIESEVSPDAPGGKHTGFYKGGIGSYIKNLDIPKEWEGKRVVVEFDGSYMCTEVYLNGNLVTKHPYGYTPFHADLTPYINYGKANRLVVTVNNTAPENGRWYTGSGLYRHVDLLTAPKIHLAPWSIFAYTERVDGRDAFVTAEVTVENHTSKDSKQFVKVTIHKEDSDEIAATGYIVVHVPAAGKASGRVSMVIEDAHIWDIDSPNLYTVKAELYTKEEKEEESIIITDTDQTLFGIRTISVDRKNGFMLNGRSLKLKGGCVHHDNGILGAASFYDSEYRKMKLHKDHGYNAIRCAHNPPSRDMLEACDRLGLLVMNEAFDVWEYQKNINDYHLYFNEWWKKDMELFMTRDRNHPSIIMWSTGNEIVERNGLSRGNELAARLADFARSLDHTRPITNGLCTPFNGLADEDMLKSLMSLKQVAEESGGTLQNLGNPYSNSKWAKWTEAFAAPLDVVGYNYMEYRYEDDGKAYPNRIICGTESYPENIDIIWDEVEKHSFVIGDFTWTSYDYIGEAGLGNTVYTDPEEDLLSNPFQGPQPEYPWRLAFDADFDLCGEERIQLQFRKIVWGSNETYIGVHNPANWGKKEHKGRWGWTESYNEWTFDGYEGKPTNVDVFSGADEVELFVNGKSLGKKPAGKLNRFKATFQVTYEPGSLLAVSYKEGVEVSRQELQTVGKAAGLKVTLEKSNLQANGQGLAYALVEIVDKEGRRVPFGDYKVKAEVSGAGTLAALGTGRPITEENYTSGEFTSYLGRLQAIVRAGYEAGEAELKVSAEGLGQASATVSIKGE